MHCFKYTPSVHSVENNVIVNKVNAVSQQIAQNQCYGENDGQIEPQCHRCTAYSDAWFLKKVFQQKFACESQVCVEVGLNVKQDTVPSKTIGTASPIQLFLL